MLEVGQFIHQSLAYNILETTLTISAIVYILFIIKLSLEDDDE